MAWNCSVGECSFPSLHTTTAHKCGTCAEYGHGQLECGDPKKIKALKKGVLPKKLHCSLPECGYPSAHVNAGHACGECGGFGHSAPQCVKPVGKKKKAESEEKEATINKKAKTTTASSSISSTNPNKPSDAESRFYNLVARNREFKENVARDVHGNVAGSLGDLGNDGAFDLWNLLIFHRVPFGVGAQNTLKKKGWCLKMVETEQKCVQEMKTGMYDIVMIISQGTRDPHKEFVPLITEHHRQGRGLLIAADNEPLFAEANAILQPLFGITLVGNTPGDQTLTPGDPTQPGHFDGVDHLITAGIDAAVYEGVTICYPNKLDHRWKVFGMSSDNHPVLISTSEDYAGGPDKPGRIVIDCGFTKFYDNYFEKGAATDRYLSNAMTWLANIELFDASAGVRGPPKPLPKKAPKKKK